MARAAASSGPPARAVAGYARAFEAGIGKAEDRFGYAAALGKVGRYADAAFQFNLVRAPQLACSRRRRTSGPARWCATAR